MEGPTVTTTSTAEWIMIEGGGSRTWTGLATDTTIVTTATGASTNPRSVGESQAIRTVITLLTDLLAARDLTGLGGVVAAHAAASTTSTAARFATVLHEAFTQLGVPDLPVWVINDIAPLLLHNQDGPVCAVIAGTDTGLTILSM